MESSVSADSVKQDTPKRPRPQVDPDVDPIPGRPTPAAGDKFGGAAVHPGGPNGVLWRALGPSFLPDVRTRERGPADGEAALKTGDAAVSHGFLLRTVTTWSLCVPNR
ncbi:hypothetical protein Slala02_37520 [Streptomyces lavendulae subsp. lavendulae]|nr:hypothetical protein Slala01_50580 [Streptomyces lavendulae subsp. lavendulae]GLX27932.1 hypothetical protein Slala02_37520 [Streptomyces lavendulae subsp. lavendulae]